jgi:adenylate cyclase
MDRVFRGCTEVLLQHDALIDKLMGDAVMAIFGAPIVRPDHAQQAVEAALTIQERAAAAFPADWQGACLRIGINSGAAFVGRVGSSDMKDYPAVGDVVNVAQRLQSEAQAGEILVAETVYERLPGNYSGAQRRVLRVKGRDEPVTAYALNA